MSTTNQNVKILTVGSAKGSIRDLFAKIKAIDVKHGKFDFVLCIGDFFGPEEGRNEADDTTLLLEGAIEAPLECYIMQGIHTLPNSVVQKYAKYGGEICKNVFLLNKSGIISTTHGLRIACLGGSYDPEVYFSAETAPGFSSPYFSAQTMAKLLSNTLSKTTTASHNYSSLASIKSAAASSQLIDILISNVLPASITELSSVPLPFPEMANLGVRPFDDTVRKTKPRYHFAAAGGQPPRFWEREPFAWSDEENRVTRFVSLGAFGGEPTEGKKQRWFYAFSISPASSTLASPPLPSNLTKNPFVDVVAQPVKRSLDMSSGENFIFGDVRPQGKRTRVLQGEPGKPPPGYKCKICESAEHFINDCPERAHPPEGYVCRICNNPGHFVRDCPTKHAVGDTGGRKPPEGYLCRACGSDAHYLDDCPAVSNRQSGHERTGGKRAPLKEITSNECWFCLSNPSIAKHLIVSIGEECYLTLPKGQIVPTQPVGEHTKIPGGGHVLVVPITHYPTLSTLPEDLAPPVLAETARYKSALRALFTEHGAVPVAFEVGRNGSRGGHAHVQIVPVPLKLAEHVESAFIRQGTVVGVDFEEDAEGALAACAGGARSYFRVDLPDGRMMIHLLKDGVPFNLQFGRQVLTTLLAMPDRMDWKACMMSDDEDKADAQAFKSAFAPFDPTLR